MDIIEQNTLKLINVSKEFRLGKEKFWALRDVNLQINKGNFVGVLGESGSGKSTLLNILGGLDCVSTGALMVDGVDIGKLSGLELAHYRNKTVGFVFQFFYLQPFLTVYDNIRLPLMLFWDQAKDKKQQLEYIENLAQKVGIADKLSYLPGKLSGGEMQRVAIARALVNEPKIILADEPTGNLDHKNAMQVMGLLESIQKEQNITIVMVTHDEGLAIRANQIIRLEKGRIVL